MKKFWLLSLGLLFALNLSAQQKQTITVLLSEIESLRNKAAYAEALNVAEKAVSLAKKNKDRKGEADIYVQMAWVNALQGNIEEAMDQNEKALQIRKNELQDNIGTAKVYSNMAVIALDLGEPDNAYKFSQFALDYCPKDSFPQLAKIYNNLGNTLEYMDSIDAAININKQAINLFSKTHDTITRVETGYSLIKKLIDRSRFEDAKDEINAVQPFASLIAGKDSVKFARVIEIKGMYFLQKTDCEADSALFYLKQAEDILKKYPEASGELSIVLFNLGEACMAKNDLTAAKGYFQGALEVAKGGDNNSYYNVSMESMISKIDAQIAAQEQSQKSQRQIYFLLLILFIAVLSTLIAVYTNLKKEKLLLHKEKENTRLVQQNFQLKHDVVKNGLITIDSVLTTGISDLEEDSPGLNLLNKVRKMIARMLSQVGYKVNGEEGEETLIPFVKELQVQAEAIYPGAENYSYFDDVDDSPISSNLREQLSLIVSEAFMNIKKHAACTEAFFEVKVNEEGLTLKIEDNGKGFYPADVHSRGLSNIEARVSEIGGQLKVISSPGNGTKIIVVVPSFPE